MDLDTRILTKSLTHDQTIQRTLPSRQDSQVTGPEPLKSLVFPLNQLLAISGLNGSGASPFADFTVTNSPSCTYTPTVTYSPSSGPVGTTFTVTGNNWVPGGTVTSTLPYGSPGWFTGYQTPTVDANGGFSYKETVGTGPNGPTPPGAYTFTYVENYGGCSRNFPQIFTVTPTPTALYFRDFCVFVSGF
jgi:hypothetical protein